MIIIQHSNGVVIDILRCRDDTTNENIAVVNFIPAYEPREGYNGVLKYGENGLYWEYELSETSDEDEISNEEVLNILLGGAS